MAFHVAIIGAGIVGTATALELLRAGHAVTLIEPDAPGGEQAASYGNAAWLSPASVVPMSIPGLWRKVPGYLLDPAGALTIRWRHLPHLLPWLTRFLLSGASVAKVERTARLLSGLLDDAPQRHAALAALVGRPELIRRDGLLYAYPDRATFAAEALSWRLRRDNGVTWRELDAAALAEFEPALDRRYTFGTLVEAGAHCFDPGAYVAALAAHAQAGGARLVRARAIDFRVEAGRLRAVRTDGGEVPCERAVLAAGIRSKALARAAGDRVFLESERGYHVVVPDPGFTLRTPVMPSDGKQGNTVTAHGLRAAGQVELCHEDAEPDWRRTDILLAGLKRSYPGLREPGGTVRRWLGHRPSTCDGLPVIGPARLSGDIVHAFGHGHIGLAAAPKTAEIVRLLLEGTPPPGTEAFQAARFR